MATRAKFTCHSVTQYSGGQADVKLGVVYDTNIQSENGRFTKATPSGEITMRVDNPEAAVQFIPGESYYVTFEPAPK
jgi:hypothetical protein